MNPAGVTRPQAEKVGLVQAQLIGDHLAGRFPDGDEYAFWLDVTTGAMTVLDIPLDNWVTHRMRDYLTVTLNVPKSEGLKPARLCSERTLRPVWGQLSTARPPLRE
jgi:hypothetical protein